MSQEIIENVDGSTSHVVHVAKLTVALIEQTDGAVVAEIYAPDSPTLRTATKLSAVDMQNYGKFFLEGIEAVLVNVDEVHGGTPSLASLHESLAALAVSSITYLDVVAGYAEVLENSALNMLDDTVAKGIAIEVAGGGMSGSFAEGHDEALGRLQRIRNEVDQLIGILEDPSEIARVRLGAMREIEAYKSAQTIDTTRCSACVAAGQTTCDPSHEG